jgi:hypothetical protein
MTCGCSSAHKSAARCYPSNRPGVTCESYPVLTQDDLPECKVALTSDNTACTQKLFGPLLGLPWPFDVDRVAKSSGPMHGGCATYVAADWQLTVEHALSAACPWPSDYRYAADGFSTENGAVFALSCAAAKTRQRTAGNGKMRMFCPSFARGISQR